MEIRPKVNALYFLEVLCDFWAQATYFISLKPIENHIKVDMSQLVALAYFIISQSQSLGLLKDCDDSTVRFLYSICHVSLSKNRDSRLIQIIDESIYLTIVASKYFKSLNRAIDLIYLTSV